MSGRHRQPVPPRSVNHRIVGAGVAGVASVFAVAPLAAAAAAPAPATPSSAQPTRPTGQAKVSPKTVTPTPKVMAAPDYGLQKVRVGVRIKSGAYVPPSGTTVGTELTIVDTAPDGTSTSNTCITVASTVVAADPTKASFCDVRGNTAQQARRGHRAGPARSEFRGLRLHRPRATRCRSRRARPNRSWWRTRRPRSVQPCLNPVQIPGLRKAGAARRAADLPTCDFQHPQQVVFEDTGLPPKAIDDRATTLVDTPVDVKVLANDSNGVTGAPVSNLTVTAAPQDGTATVHAGVHPQLAGGASQIAAAGYVTYKPKAGFVGTDHFTYRFATPNGTASAVATIVVTPPPPKAVDDSRTTPYNTPITIAVPSNDDANGGGALTITTVGDPKHGTATIDGSSVVYTPSHNFSGVDTFTYTISTPYGSDTATVTVTITAPLAATGVGSGELVDYGLALLLAGGAVTTLGRRRRPHGRHGV